MFGLSPMYTVTKRHRSGLIVLPSFLSTALSRASCQNTSYLTCILVLTLSKHLEEQVYFRAEGGIPGLARIFHKISVAPANLTPYQALYLPTDFDV